jgi:hypothetical protein
MPSAGCCSHPVGADMCFVLSLGISLCLHFSTIKLGYQAVLHCGMIRQTAQICRIQKECLRTGDKSICRFRFLLRDEYLHTGAAFVFREGSTKGIGKVVRINFNEAERAEMIEEEIARRKPHGKSQQLSAAKLAAAAAAANTGEGTAAADAAGATPAAATAASASSSSTGLIGSNSHGHSNSHHHGGKKYHSGSVHAAGHNHTHTHSHNAHGGGGHEELTAAAGGGGGGGGGKKWISKEKSDSHQKTGEGGKGKK